MVSAEVVPFAASALLAKSSGYSEALDKLKKRVTGRGFKDVRERLQFHISISEKILRSIFSLSWQVRS